MQTNLTSDWWVLCSVCDIQSYSPYQMQLANSISAEEQAMHMQQYVVSPESRDSLYR